MARPGSRRLPRTFTVREGGTRSAIPVNRTVRSRRPSKKHRPAGTAVRLRARVRQRKGGRPFETVTRAESLEENPGKRYAGGFPSTGGRC